MVGLFAQHDLPGKDKDDALPIGSASNYNLSVVLEEDTHDTNRAGQVSLIPVSR